MRVIRLFDWRDVHLLHRLRHDGLCLDAQLAYTRPPHALQHALLDAIDPGPSRCTVVSRPRVDTEPDCFGQITFHNGGGLARLAFISPQSSLETDTGCRLLDGLAQAAGERGARSLVAEVDEGLTAAEAIHQAGFAVYARQRIWRLSHPLEGEAVGPSDGWRPELPHDEMSVINLYYNLVPGLVQQVESSPRYNGRGWVHAQQHEVLGYLGVERGPLGSWVQPYLHPATDHVEALIRAFAASHPWSPQRPMYFVVRSYQSWLHATLDRLGFEAVSDQAVMVKRLAVAIRQPAPSAELARAAAKPEPTAPFIHFDGRSSSHGNNGGP